MHIICFLHQFGCSYKIGDIINTGFTTTETVSIIWLNNQSTLKNPSRGILDLKASEFIKIKPSALDPMERSIKRSVMTFSVLQKSSIQHFLIHLHSIKLHPGESIGCPYEDSIKSVNLWVQLNIQTSYSFWAWNVILTPTCQCC